jgi:hypothetical protein
MPQVPTYGRQSINEDDIEAVCHVLRSDFLKCNSNRSTLTFSRP